MQCGLSCNNELKLSLHVMCFRSDEIPKISMTVGMTVHVGEQRGEERKAANVFQGERGMRHFSQNTAVTLHSVRQTGPVIPNTHRHKHTLRLLQQVGLLICHPGRTVSHLHTDAPFSAEEGCTHTHRHIYTHSSFSPPLQTGARTNLSFFLLITCLSSSLLLRFSEFWQTNPRRLGTTSCVCVDMNFVSFGKFMGTYFMCKLYLSSCEHFYTVHTCVCANPEGPLHLLQLAELSRVSCAGDKQR